MKEAILSYLSAQCPWRDRLHWFDTIDSTNTQAKAAAKAGALHGTVLIAGQQTQGRGRLGRSFHSPADSGMYLSVILRPACKPEELMHLTCSAAVAMCSAVKNAAGIRPSIKWTNDLIIGTKKLGGILTELSVDPTTGLVEYAVVGVGINCNQSTSDFPEELRDMATSLKMEAANAPAREELAAAMIDAFIKMDAALLPKKQALMESYRHDCITVGKEISVLRGSQVRYGTALGVDDAGALIVRFRDGSTEAVSSGEVSVRGMYGYIS